MIRAVLDWNVKIKKKGIFIGKIDMVISTICIYTDQQGQGRKNELSV